MKILFSLRLAVLIVGQVMISIPNILSPDLLFAVVQIEMTLTGIPNLVAIDCSKSNVCLRVSKRRVTVNDCPALLRAAAMSSLLESINSELDFLRTAYLVISENRAKRCSATFQLVGKTDARSSS